MTTSKVAIVVGGAACNFDDIRSLPEDVVRSAAFIAVNDVGTVLPYQLRAWVSLHPEKFAIMKPFWINKRIENGYGMEGCNVAGWNKDSKPRTMAGVTFWSDYLSQGSSGLFGVGMAILMGYKQIICCGIPMNLQINKFLNRPSFSTDKAADVYRPFWEQSLSVLRNRVYSQSGWTKELLGSWTEKDG